MLFSLRYSSQAAVQRHPDSNVSSPWKRGTKETVIFLVQKGEAIPSASWWVEEVPIISHCEVLLFEQRECSKDFYHNCHGYYFYFSSVLSHFSLCHVLSEMLSIFELLHTNFFFILCSQMTSNITMGRARPSTLASWSTLPLPSCLWPSLVCLTICLTWTTMTDMWSMLCLTWSGVLLYWRCGE